MNVVVAGWGGAGKTTIAGTLARVIAARGPAVLVVEDDPAPTLATTLGIERAGEVAPLPDDLLNRVGPAEGEADFVLAKPPQAIIDDYGVEAPGDVTLLTLAPVEHRDSYGVASTYRTAQKILRRVLQAREEVTVIDGVTGVENLPHETIAAVDVLLVIVAPHYKSIEVGRRTAERAAELGVTDVRLVANQIRNAAQRAAIEAVCVATGLELGGVVPFDDAIPQALQTDRAPIDDAPDTAAVRAVGTLAEDLLAAHARNHGTRQSDADQ